MNFKIIITSLLFVVLHQAIGQNLSLSYTSRYETFDMDELKELQDFHSVLWPVSPELLVDMPNRFSSALSLESFLNDRNAVGLTIGHSNTGRRYYYEDYSGLIYSNLRVKRIEFVSGYTNYLSVRNFHVLFRGEGGLNYSQLLWDSRIQFNGEEYTSRKPEYSYHSWSISGKFGLGVEKRFNKIFVRSFVLYEYNIPNSMKYKEDHEVYIVNYNNDKVDANWSGIKMNVALGYFIQ